MSDSSCGSGCPVGRDHFRRVRRLADGLHTGVFTGIAIAGDDNVAVELAADLFAVFHDGCLGAYLHSAVLKSFDQIDCDDFFEGHNFPCFQSSYPATH